MYYFFLDYYSPTRFGRLTKSNEKQRQRCFEKLYSKVEREFDESRPKRPRRSIGKLKGLDSMTTEDLLEMVSSKDDFFELRVCHIVF
jgi:hypothetical protein